MQRKKLLLKILKHLKEKKLVFCFLTDGEFLTIESIEKELKS
jgi:hypothetical protein